MMKKVALLIAILAFTFLAFSGCKAQEPEAFPAIKVSSGGVEISTVIGKNRLNGAVYDREPTLRHLMSRCAPSDLVHVQNGETIAITFEGTAPDTATLTEHIINADGSMKYESEYSGTVIDIVFTDGKGSFTLEPNFATVLSSDGADYAPGATLKGYRLTCDFGDDQCEYAFAIRSDAAIAFQPQAARELLDYFYDSNMPNASRALDIPEFPDVEFRWSPAYITANGENLLFGMPIWNVFLADLNGDNLPELCATAGWSSGMIDDRVAAYDYAHRQFYGLEDRGTYDYQLSLEDGQPIVNQKAYDTPPKTGPVLGKSSLTIVDGALIAANLNRTPPE